MKGEGVVWSGFFRVYVGTEQHVARCVLGIPTLTRLITAIHVALLHVRKETRKAHEKREREGGKGRNGRIVYISTRIPLTLWTGDALLPSECGSVAFSYWTSWIKRERLPVYRRNTNWRRWKTYECWWRREFSEYFRSYQTVIFFRLKNDYRPYDIISTLR